MAILGWSLLTLTLAFADSSHLKYFGYFDVDCAAVAPGAVYPFKTNYVDEVAGFSNLGHLCVYHSMDNIDTRVKAFAERKILAILDLSGLFFRQSSTPSVHTNLDLYPDFERRWLEFRKRNSPYLNTHYLAAVMPARRMIDVGVTTEELKTVSAMLARDLPQVPLLLVEDAAHIDKIGVPPQMSWLGLSALGVTAPAESEEFKRAWRKFKTLRTRPEQKFFLVAESQWLQRYNSPTHSSMQMKDVITRYYELARKDEDVSGILNVTWAGAEAKKTLGLRNLPEEVLNEHKRIGRLILNAE
jgi:hypothetical protein